MVRPTTSQTRARTAPMFFFAARTKVQLEGDRKSGAGKSSGQQKSFFLVKYWSTLAKGDTKFYPKFKTISVEEGTNFAERVYKVSLANLIEGFGVSTVYVPQLSIIHIVGFNEI